MHQFNYDLHNLCVFTDMDGTILGHYDYAYAPVLPVLEKLAQQKIPVVVNSSKTFAEIAIWLRKLHLQPPFVAENGGVIYFDAEKILLGRAYSEIRTLLETLRLEHGWRFEGFGDMTVERVVDVTGLTVDEAVNAKAREVSEPLLWHDSEEALQGFCEVVASHDLQVVRGGRFYHVMGWHDKAKAMQKLLEMRVLQGRDSVISTDNSTVMALGDGSNDLPMLRAADIAVILPAGNFTGLELAENPQATPKKVIYASAAAPAGWALAMEEILLAMD